jgi:hypothetical protein
VLTIAAAFDPGVPASAFDQDPTHGPCRGTEKVTTVIPSLGIIGPQKSQVRLMNERGGLQGVPGGFVGQACAGEAAQLVVHQGQQVGSCLGVSLTGLAEESGEMFGLVRIGHLMVF